MRVGLIQTRTQAKNRVTKVLEDTNIKVASVVADRFGVSGRRMRAALIAGERNPQVLANLAVRRFRRKLPELEIALPGQFSAFHAKLIQLSRELIALLDWQIAILAQQIGALVAPLTPQIEQLTSLPGVEATAARAVLVETGTEMSRVGSATRLASWAGVCPGNNEGASKQRRGRMRTGNRYLRRVLVQGAWVARKMSTYLGRTFRRLEARLGRKKAAVAIAHKLLGIVYHLLAEGTFYDEERYDRLQPRQEEHQRKRAVKALAQLGYQVSLAKVA